jgi:hypothetical protein
MCIYIYALTVLASILAAQPVFAADQCGGTVISGDIRWPKDNGNGTVTDSNTGLTWSKCLYGQSGDTCTGTIDPLLWSDALAQTTTKWRLPNIKELQSIVKEENAVSATKRAINTVCFPTPDASTNIYVWSSSPYAGYLSNAWSIDFKDGLMFNIIPQSESNYVRYVCDGDATTCNTTPPAP